MEIDTTAEEQTKQTCCTPIKDQSHLSGIFVTQDGHAIEHFEALSWLHTTPVLNVVYDLFFDVAPSPSELSATLNIFALVDALMLSVITSLIFSYSYEDYHSMIERWTFNEDDDQWPEGYGLYLENEGKTRSEYYQAIVSTHISATYCFGIGLFLTITIYIALAHTSFQKKKGEINHAMVVAWWKYAKVAFFLAFLATAIGVFVFFFFFNRFLAAMLPDLTLEHIDTVKQMKNFDGGMIFSKHRPGEYGRHWALVVLLPVWGVSFICLSLALSAKNKAYVATTKQDDNEFCGLKEALVKLTELKNPDGAYVMYGWLKRPLQRDLASLYEPRFQRQSIYAEQIQDLTIENLIGVIQMPLGDAIEWMKGIKAASGKANSNSHVHANDAAGEEGQDVARWDTNPLQPNSTHTKQSYTD